MGVAVDRVAARPDEVAPQALGGLAAFYAQPADEDDVESALAPFDWSLLADDPDEWWGAPTAPMGDSDNYLGEFWIRELADELSRRREIAAPVVALVLGDGRVVAVPR